MARIALSLGSNLGNKRDNIAKALAALDQGGARIVACSADYRTEPWGSIDQDWFVNACAVAETDLTPGDLLALCLRVERELGRVREVRWGPRVIDIDIITYDDLQVGTPTLTLPHPYVAERAFVLLPLAEIAPELNVGGRSVADMLANVSANGIAKLP
ncbi:2-amino-4-hydroxy-6-hydroxymethyldihydropteridine diphosphokinase [Microvirga makkahensis]|uniref:2-amino-4-hydroxy-6-hydroxymethyldihydropteridine pyrophosphokinase n=1 Tax=Microvirga makkahensis TaxID=1128670 RepID=A0A7X3SQV2_9HYPH|nr:2-amino-4-hydroxy-6-hydroxymethyldihydropteridine diphosphokinase [Microvirga makkahensis]MXQ13892.1 2-amino-4-hydroxy-6-hydroxymethyldihydropteridine diphosphokinase [Microvirga makkahensis]